MTIPLKERKSRTWPDKLAGAGLLVACAVLLALTYAQFRGDFTAKTRLTMLAARAGLVMDRGSKVTYNGVEIGRVADISEVDHHGEPAAKFTLDVNPRYLGLIPANVQARIQATTVFGNKYVSFTAPKHPSPQSISPNQLIDAISVTTEFDTLFQTITQLSEQIDPVKVNLTLSAAADALSGLGDKFGASIVNGNAILDDANARMPAIHHDVRQLAALAQTYADGAPDLVDFLEHALMTARTLNAAQHELDAALLAAVGFGDTGDDILRRSRPYLVRLLADLRPTAGLLDTYSPELFCTIRNIADLVPTISVLESGNHYSAQLGVALAGAENPYVMFTTADTLPKNIAYSEERLRPPPGYRDTTVPGVFSPDTPWSHRNSEPGWIVAPGMQGVQVSPATAGLLTPESLAELMGGPDIAPPPAGRTMPGPPDAYDENSPLPPPWYPQPLPSPTAAPTGPGQ